MFATIVVCGLIAGSSRAHYMSGAGRGGNGLQLNVSGAGAGWTCNVRAAGRATHIARGAGMGYPHWVAGRGRAGKVSPRRPLTAIQ